MGIRKSKHQPKKKEKPIIITGKALTFGQPNLNGRIYHEDAFNDGEIYKKIQAGNMLGTLGQDDARPMIELGNISHRVTDMNIELDENLNKILTVKAEVLEGTPKGQMLKEMIESGVQIGIASRGIGNLDASGNVEDYQLISFDLIPKQEAANPDSEIRKLLDDEL